MVLKTPSYLNLRQFYDNTYAPRWNGSHTGVSLSTARVVAGFTSKHQRNRYNVVENVNRDFYRVSVFNSDDAQTPNFPQCMIAATKVYVVEGLLMSISLNPFFSRMDVYVMAATDTQGVKTFRISDRLKGTKLYDQVKRQIHRSGGRYKTVPHELMFPDMQL